MLERIFHGPELADAVRREVVRARADVIVVDYLLRSAAAVAELLPAPHVLLIHTIFGFHGGAADDRAARRRWFEPVNAARRSLGVEGLPVGSDSVTVELTRRAAGAIVALPREFDDWDDPPANVVHAGPIIERPGRMTRWSPPWGSADARPLVVVSLGTQYMHQTDVLRRIADALRAAPVRGLVLTGEIDPAEIPGGANLAIESYVPHETVLSDASVVVTHAGTGTLLAAFAAGLPVLCVPLGRDQPQNARRVAELGLGFAIDPGAEVADIAAALAEVLDAPAYRQHATSMSSVIRGYEGGAPAVRMLEQLAARATPN